MIDHTAVTVIYYCSECQSFRMSHLNCRVVVSLTVVVDWENVERGNASPAKRREAGCGQASSEVQGVEP